jgi:hypothetical protein
MSIPITYIPANSSWLNRIPGSPRCSTYALDGAGHPSHQQQASMIRRYIIWCNNHAYDQRLRRFIDRANVA